MEECIVERINSKVCSSIFEMTFELGGDFGVRLTDQETYKKLQQMKLEGKVD